LLEILFFFFTQMSHHKPQNGISSSAGFPLGFFSSSVRFARSTMRM
jgi:hypothetical protein